MEAYSFYDFVIFIISNSVGKVASNQTLKKILPSRNSVYDAVQLHFEDTIALILTRFCFGDPLREQNPLCEVIPPPLVPQTPFEIHVRRSEMLHKHGNDSNRRPNFLSSKDFT
jgi:hypothetical protein